MYFIILGMYFRVNLKMKKPTLCCFTWTVVSELNFKVAFLLIKKTWDDTFAGKVGGWGILRNEGDQCHIQTFFEHIVFLKLRIR